MLSIFFALGCGKPAGPGSGPRPTDSPVSVRGWIADIDLPPSELMKVADPALMLQRKYALFRSTNIAIEGAPFASGAVSEWGSFILLDVPPGDVTIYFTPPGIGEAVLQLKNVPGNADVMLPALKIKGNKVIIGNPAEAIVRLAGSGTVRKKLEMKVFAGDTEMQVYEVPLGEMNDRRDYPVITRTAPAGTVTVK